MDSLKTFATRAFNNELATQQTIVGDLLGGKFHGWDKEREKKKKKKKEKEKLTAAGAYNLIQHSDSEASIEATVARVQTVADEWDTILARSAWCRAVGALVESISAKIVRDIMDLPSIGQEEAYQMARMISVIGELDKLFLPSRLSGGAAAGAGAEQGEEEISKIAGFVPSWLRMQFLSEVLQSNLNEVKYLWFESDLSVYFSAEEVVDLIGLSFEMNARAKEVVREIKQQPCPRG